MLINNAGIDYFDSFHKISTEEMNNLIKVNVFPTMHLTRYFIPIFLKRYQEKNIRSAILNVASLAGVIPSVYFNVYSGTKGFVNIFT